MGVEAQPNSSDARPTDGPIHEPAPGETAPVISTAEDSCGVSCQKNVNLSSPEDTNNLPEPVSQQAPTHPAEVKEAKVESSEPPPDPATRDTTPTREEYPALQQHASVMTEHAEPRDQAQRARPNNLPEHRTGWWYGFESLHEYDWWCIVVALLLLGGTGMKLCSSTSPKPVVSEKGAARAV